MDPAGGNWLWWINQVPVGSERTGTFRLSVRLRQNNVEKLLHLNGMNSSWILDLIIYLFSLFACFFQLYKSLGDFSKRKVLWLCSVIRGSLHMGHWWAKYSVRKLISNTESDKSSRGSCSNHSHIYTVSVQILAQHKLLFNKDIVQTALFGLFQWNERKISTSRWQLYVWSDWDLLKEMTRCKTLYLHRRHISLSFCQTVTGCKHQNRTLSCPPVMSVLMEV